jgi:hypothetical protein
LLEAQHELNRRINTDDAVNNDNHGAAAAAADDDDDEETKEYRDGNDFDGGSDGGDRYMENDPDVLVFTKKLPHKLMFSAPASMVMMLQDLDEDDEEDEEISGANQHHLKGGSGSGGGVSGVSGTRLPPINLFASPSDRPVANDVEMGRLGPEYNTDNALHRYENLHRDELSDEVGCDHGGGSGGGGVHDFDDDDDEEEEEKRRILAKVRAMKREMIQAGVFSAHTMGANERKQRKSELGFSRSLQLSNAEV